MLYEQITQDYMRFVDKCGELYEYHAKSCENCKNRIECAEETKSRAFIDDLESKYYEIEHLMRIGAIRAYRTLKPYDFDYTD